jgi:DnaK suppressor protein
MDTKIESARKSLLARQVELRDDLERVSEEIRSIGIEEGREGGVGNHPADDGSSVMEGERLTTISGNLHEALMQIDSALERIEDGTFGICQRCKQEIGAERLEAFPYVAYCINCQTIIEREQFGRVGR